MTRRRPHELGKSSDTSSRPRASGTGRGADRAAGWLTEREVEVLRLVAIGISNDDIARRLVVSPRTVHTQVRALFAKLGVLTRAAAAHEASLLNLL